MGSRGWIAAVAAGGALALAGGDAAAADAAAPSVRELVGQRLVVALHGTTPSASLLRRVRQGEVGGVILFGGNVEGPAQVRGLVDRLQQAARDGGRPPLLVMADQEGGPVRRLPWAGPALPASDLGRLGARRIRAEARQAGIALRAAGVTVDLAPVADVPGPGSFLAVERRTLGASPGAVRDAAVAFALGLADADVAAAVKHFPGIGAAVRTTDRAAVRIPGGRAALERALVPFRAAVAAGVPLVMIANASYPALDGKPAAWSPAVQSLLRRDLGFAGVTITDALDPAAATHGRSLPSVAVLAAQAGVDLLLVVGGEGASGRAHARLVAAAEAGRIPAASLRRSYDRILALKRAYASPARGR